MLFYRFAAPADTPEIVALVESAYRGEASRAGWTTEADLLDGRRTGVDEIAALIASPASRIVLAHREDELIACAHLERHAGYAYFGMFSVRPTEQNSGIGRQLLAEAERIVAAEWRLPELRMRVISARDELIAWYQRRGYRRTGELSPFPYGDQRFGIPKREGLQFELLVKSLRP